MKLIIIFVVAMSISVALKTQAEDYNYDVDGDGVQNALTDGTLIQRYLFGFRGSQLCDGIVDPGNCGVTQERIRKGSCKACVEPPTPEPSPPDPDPQSCANYPAKDDGKNTGHCTAMDGSKITVVNPAPGGWTIPPTCVNNRSDGNSRCENDGSSILPGQIWSVRVKHKAKNQNDQTRPVSYTKSETPGEMVIKYEVSVSSIPGNFEVDNPRCRSTSTVTTLDESSPYSGFCKIPVGTSYANFRPLRDYDEKRCNRSFGSRCRPKILGGAFYE